MKAAKTTQCVLFLNCPLDQSLTHNETSKLYSEETIKALHLRFEAPQSTARWDSPLFETRYSFGSVNYFFENPVNKNVQKFYLNLVTSVPNLNNAIPNRTRSLVLVINI